MNTLLRTRATAVWAILIAATTVSWLLGADDILGAGAHRLASALILFVALFKVRLVGLYFMDLRNAPLPLRGIFEGYCAAVCGLTIGMFLFA